MFLSLVVDYPVDKMMLLKKIINKKSVQTSNKIYDVPPHGKSQRFGGDAIPQKRALP